MTLSLDWPQKRAVSLWWKQLARVVFPGYSQKLADHLSQAVENTDPRLVRNPPLWSWQVSGGSLGRPEAHSGS